jgi:Ca2+-transporting ATPase
MVAAMGAPHATPPGEVAAALGTDPEHGLSQAEAHARELRFGPNALETARSPAYAAIAARQLADPLVALLIAAGVVSAVIGEGVEAVAIGMIVVLNGALGFGQEVRAERAILALSKALQRHASVIRDGREGITPVESLVPGDLVVLREGDGVPADARLVHAEGLAIDESLLTGESIPSDKSVDSVPEDTPLADRTCLAFGGTAVTRGRATALVIAIGGMTEVGQVGALAAGATPPPTPLQLRLGRLTRAMVLAGVAITISLAGLRLAQGVAIEDAFLLGVSVAVAAVPEGLAATVTIALALGARRMAARGAIVRRLPAVETLGSATVVASDKTGTLTENDLRVRVVAPAQGRTERELLEAAVLASTAEVVGDPARQAIVGDPVEVALLLGADGRGISLPDLRAGRRILHELPFDAERKMMTLVYAEEGAVRVYTKGAPEVVLGRLGTRTGERSELEKTAVDWASQGLRVLAIATRTLGADTANPDALEHDLEPLGLVALHDPLRATAPEAVAGARAAGLEVRILTGDHPATAGAIARELALPETAVSARVTPREKLNLVRGLQRSGEVVAVTGDGVNDAPALRQANIGVAMGRSGTETAREVADVVLTDDDFSTIVAAIREGRTIMDNVRKFVAFLISANFGEVVLFAAAVLGGLGAPMTVVQVLVINVLTDGLPAVALATDPAERDVMSRPPERGQRLFNIESWGALALVGVTIGAAALTAFLIGREMGADAGQTMAFATLGFAELIVVFAVRSPIRSFFTERLNRSLLAAVALSAALLLAVVYVSPLQDAAGTTSLDGGQLAIVAVLALAPFALVEAVKPALRRAAPGWARS